MMVIKTSKKPKILRGDFLQTRVFFWKIAQNYATRPSEKIFRRHLGFTSFSKILAENEHFYSFFCLLDEKKYLYIKKNITVSVISYYILYQNCFVMSIGTCI